MRLFLFLIFLNVVAAGHAGAQQLENDRITRLEQKVDAIDHEARDAGGAGLALILFGAFCALWAQNTGRSAWLWFFLGFAFNVITIFFLLTKNSSDNFERRRFGRTAREKRAGQSASL